VPPTRASLRRAPRDLDELPVVLRVDEVAELLRVDPWTVYSWCRSGRLPHRRLGRVIRFDRDRIAAFMAGEDGDPTAVGAEV
jgi:excisionase family DNA binding protein